MRTKRREPKVGDHVTCQARVPAYYSDYGGNPTITFLPGMVGVVAAVAPKVRARRKADLPLEDCKEIFLVVDYFAPETGKTERVGLNYSNAIVV